LNPGIIRGISDIRKINDQGQESKKTTRISGPHLGVHLGDNKDQVKAALGNNYKETPPGEEIGHF
jgi:hypothetical protein